MQPDLGSLYDCSNVTKVGLYSVPPETYCSQFHLKDIRNMVVEVQKYSEILTNINLFLCSTEKIVLFCQKKFFGSDSVQCVAILIASLFIADNLTQYWSLCFQHKLLWSAFIASSDLNLSQSLAIYRRICLIFLSTSIYKDLTIRSYYKFYIMKLDTFRTNCLYLFIFIWSIPLVASGVHSVILNKLFTNLQYKKNNGHYPYCSSYASR